MPYIAILEATTATYLFLLLGQKKTFAPRSYTICALQVVGSTPWEPRRGLEPLTGGLQNRYSTN